MCGTRFDFDSIVAPAGGLREFLEGGIPHRDFRRDPSPIVAGDHAVEVQGVENDDSVAPRDHTGPRTEGSKKGAAYSEPSRRTAWTVPTWPGREVTRAIPFSVSIVAPWVTMFRVTKLGFAGLVLTERIRVRSVLPV